MGAGGVKINMAIWPHNTDGVFGNPLSYPHLWVGMFRICAKTKAAQVFSFL